MILKMLTPHTPLKSEQILQVGVRSKGNILLPARAHLDPLWVMEDNTWPGDTCHVQLDVIY